MLKLLQIVRTFRNNEDGATALEYGLIAALIAVAIIGGLTTLGTNLDTMFDSVSTEISDNTPE